MQTLPLISLTIFLPLAGAAALMLCSAGDPARLRQLKYTALWISAVAFFCSLGLLFQFDPDRAGFQLEERVAWLPALSIFYHVGLDGISIWLVVLVAFLTPLCLLVSWHSIDKRGKEFLAVVLMLESTLIGAFSAMDLVVFYLFYELSSVPMFLLIGIWGREQRVQAAIRFFLYTMAGSVFLLLAIIVLYAQAGTFEVDVLMQTDLPIGVQTWLWLAMFVSFAIKMPLWPMHTWLPEAHVQAPTAGSMLLAGALVKLGSYGFLRFLVPLFPDASATFTPLVYALATITILYNSVVAFSQTDIKKLLAYATVAHMGVAAIGAFSWTQQGLEGTILLFVAHGLVSAGLFACAGLFFERRGSYDLGQLNGLVDAMPRTAVVSFLLVLGALALPGTASFLAEMLIFVGVFQVNTWAAVLASLVVVLAPAYMLRFYHAVMFDTDRPAPAPASVRRQDLSWREAAAVVPMVVVAIWLGLYASSFTVKTSETVKHMVETHPRVFHAMAPGRSERNDAVPVGERFSMLAPR